MTDAGKRTIHILAGVRRARELLVSRESSLAMEAVIAAMTTSGLQETVL